MQLDDSYARMHDEVAPGPYVMIAVSDTGHGIPAAIRDKVFEPFFTTKGVGKGTGLGLSMVYGFVKQSGGHIKIYSEEGHGTTIKIYLPRAGEQVGEAAADSPARARGRHRDDPGGGGRSAGAQLRGDPAQRPRLHDAHRRQRRRSARVHRRGEELRSPVHRRDHAGVAQRPAARRRGDAAAARAQVLYTSGYTEDAIVHHGRLDPGVLLLAKPYRKSDLARMVRIALARSGEQGVDARQPPLPSIDAAE